MKAVWRKMFRLVPAVIIIVLIILAIRNRFSGCLMSRLDSANMITMNTVAKVIAVAPDEQAAEAAIAAGSEKIFHLEKLMNRYDPDSQISLVNSQAFNGPVKVDPDLFAVIEQSVYYSNLTGAAFDITVAPLIDLFKSCAEANNLPTIEQFAEAKEKIGSKKIILDKENFSIRFAVRGMKIDLGAIAKGFAIDIVTEEMKKCGAVGGLVDIGGDIGCFGLTEKEKKWIIGLQNPSELSEGQTVAKLSLTNTAVATSGDYRRFYTIAGRNFSHIFNPVTEKSAAGLSSVTVIAPKAAAADALATAISVLGPQKGLDLIENMPKTEAVMIRSADGGRIETSGAGRYILE